MNPEATYSGGRRVWFGIALASIILAGTFAVTCHTIGAYAATFAISAGLPVAVLPATAAFPRHDAAMLVACAIAQCLALWSIARLIHRSQTPPHVVWIAAGIGLSVMSAIAFTARGTLSQDAYTYMQYARTTSFSGAYTRAAKRDVPPPFRAPGVFVEKGVPCVYGPMWLAVDRALLAGAPSQASAYRRLRLAGIVEIILLIALLAAAGIGTTALLSLALCPPMYEFFVVEAHNDLLALLILAAAAALVRTRFASFAVVVAAVAALVKLNFALLAFAALARPQPVRRRIIEALVIIGIAVVGSALFAGRPYLHALQIDGFHRARDMSMLKFATLQALKAPSAIVAVVAVLLAFARDRWWRAAAWTIPTLGPLPYPWYAPWALPFVLREPSFGSIYVATMPLLAVMLDHAITTSFGLGLVGVYLAAATALALVLRRQVPVPGPSLAGSPPIPG